ncbi:hypothetical protein BH11GEM2_BH11GEM2_37410 [soil metagenome]
MIFLMVVQVILPLGLALWLLFQPPRDWLTFGLVALAAALVTSALVLTGLWTILPWWWPWGCAGISFASVLRAVPRKRSLLPRGWRAGAGAVALALVGIGAWFTLQGIAGRHFPTGFADLAFPLPHGRYIVANGGANLAVSSHAETLDLSVPRYRLWQGQSYGVDIVALNAAGRSTSGFIPTDPRRYAIYGRPVLAPCAGLIVVAVDTVQDSPIPLNSEVPSAGNHVVLRCGGVDIVLAHFRPGSLHVPAGTVVVSGQLVAEVGNSGSSTEPHLHVHAQSAGTAAAPFSGSPLPIRLDQRMPLRNTHF